MIEATCSACGTLNRVSEASVPVGAKFVTCADCKARVALPAGAAAPAASASLGGRLPPKPPAGGGSDAGLDFADLPAPKRTSALGAEPARPPKIPPAKSAGRSGLAAALDPDLPAPKAMRSTAAMAVPPPPPGIDPGLDLDDLRPAGPGPGLDQRSAPTIRGLGDGIDLPAPKKSARPAAPPVWSNALDEPALDELAPKATGRGTYPAGTADGSVDDLGVMDLPAPKGERSVSDLPAPKRTIKRSVPDMPAAKEPARPPPVPSQPLAIADLPAPKRGPAIADVPPPRAAAAARDQGVVDLPAPKGFFDDIATARGSGTQSGLGVGAPPGVTDLPAPKGFFDDLPQPALRQPPELPAPKGFFDDLPQVKANPSGQAGQSGPSAAGAAPGVTDLPAPKGFFDDLPQPAIRQPPDLPAPKGFFENLPQVKSNPSTTPELPAPKGFFDDIPGLPSTAKPELPAPQGFFDDIPGLPNRPPEPPSHDLDSRAARAARPADDLAPRGFFDDLPHPPAAAPAPPAEPAGSRRGAAALELDSGPELELLSTSSPAPPPASFDDLDLSKPTSNVRFEPAARTPARPAVSGPAPVMAPRFEEPSLELEGAVPGQDAPRPVVKRPAKPPAADAAAAKQTRARQRKLALGGLAVVAALGGGGFWMYQRHVAAQERADAIAAQMEVARTSYAASDPAHWQRAGAAAQRVIALDPKHGEALGIGAESLLASVLADGAAAPGKVAQARVMLDTANSAGIASPPLSRARALSLLAARQPDAALAQIKPQADAAPKDPVLALYLGWALAAKGNHLDAVQAFTPAVEAAPTKVPGLYGRGSSKLQLSDLEGATSDFSAVLELAKDHIGAQIGLAAALPPSDAQQQEADLVAILARKDIATTDPRIVARAWTLAGNAAARAGRLGVARERFMKALAAVPQDLAATTGLAQVELGDGKVGAAAELMATALNIAKDDLGAQLVQCEIELKQGKLPVAVERMAALSGRLDTLPPLDQARMMLVAGKILEAQGKDDEAIEAYQRGAKAAGNRDLAPLMAAVGKLATMTTAADAAKDTARASQLRASSEQLLGGLADLAERDPRLAMTLGMAYLQAGDAGKAETWLARVTTARPDDAEARYQLGRAQLKANKAEDAIASLNAALAKDRSRTDIAVDLARAYELLGRDADAAAQYTKILASREPGLEARVQAGRFYARTRAFDKAGEQGEHILESDPRNATGLYLRGEGLLASNKAVDAKQALQRALEIERDPVYFDALGRAAEALAANGDRELQDLALRSYIAAAETEPPPLNALAGQGRLYVARHEAAKAVTPLLAAARIDPKDAEVMFLTGAAYQELQQSAIALQWLEASTKIAPRAEAFWRIGQLRRDGNQGALAADALGNATRLAEESEKRTGKPVAWLTDALYLQGRVNFDLHNDAAARQAWHSYVARNPPRSARYTEVQQLLATSLR